MTHSFPTRRSADLELVAVRPGRASSSRTKTTSIAAPTTRAPPTSSTRKSAARPTNSRCASVNQNRKIMADDDYVYEEASGERSEEHTSELQSLMRISYAVCCLNKKNKRNAT